jgi:hypothetical protein
MWVMAPLTLVGGANVSEKHTASVFRKQLRALSSIFLENIGDYMPNFTAFYDTRPQGELSGRRNSITVRFIEGL